ncbi:hypothetical protein AB3N04_00045 (plasmid) [Alkalihalophilus sp. As8PL]|uniref:Uncharacterized protein n=1 Tax=Alkalihalophilus sp. As8PL TaxID=3237103 RepID=A0AB39BN30_9BACI
MDNNEIKQIIEELRNGSLKSYHVPKNYFMDFRNVLVQCDDFQSFRGNAQVGGSVVYTYEPGWTK